MSSRREADSTGNWPYKTPATALDLATYPRCQAASPPPPALQTKNFKIQKASQKMKTTLGATALAAAAFANIAIAGETTYYVSGTLTDIRGSGAGFSFGNKFQATYKHDDSPQIGRLVEP